MLMAHISTESIDHLLILGRGFHSLYVLLLQSLDGSLLLVATVQRPASQYLLSLQVNLLCYFLYSVPHMVFFLLGLVYTYLAGHVGRMGEQGAFRALTRGYTHWTSGLLQQLEVNTNNPNFCHVRVAMKPSM